MTAGVHPAAPPRVAKASRPWLWLSAACLVPAVLDAFQIWLKARTEGDGRVEWNWVVWQGGEWIILGTLIPLAYVLGRRYPLRRPLSWRAVTVHTVGALALCVGWATLGMGMGMLLGTAPPTLRSWMLTSLPWSVFMYFATLGCVHAFTYFVEARERESQAARLSAQLAEARLQALRTQLHPHFLFNSLNAVLVLVRDRDTAAAARMLERLGELLRRLLRADAATTLPLADEMAFIDDYLAIEQERFSDRLTVEREVAPGVEGARVPPFVLQPLVENALRHGIAPSERGGRVTIAARRDGDDLVLSVTDTGVGPRGAIPGTGVGIRNLRERLETMYGSRTSVTLQPRAEGGAVATIRLPLEMG
jgi:two-component system, LytTR family, sensor kinase